MKHVLGWEPLVWTVRASGIVLLVLTTYVALLYAARYLRPKTIRALVGIDAPSSEPMDDDYAAMLRDLEASRLDMREIARLRAAHYAAERRKEAIYKRVLGYVPVAIKFEEGGPYRWVRRRKILGKRRRA